MTAPQTISSNPNRRQGRSENPKSLRSQFLLVMQPSPLEKTEAAEEMLHLLIARVHQSEKCFDAVIFGRCDELLDHRSGDPVAAINGIDANDLDPCDGSG